MVRAATRGRRAALRRMRRTTVGARAIVRNERGEILLVHNIEDDRWYLPGGGAEVGESLIETARRETREETGLVLTGDPRRFHGLFTNLAEGRTDHIAVFSWVSEGKLVADGLENQDAAWFDPANLPPATSPGTRRRVAELDETDPLIDIW